MSAKLQKSVKIKINIIILENHGVILGNMYSYVIPRHVSKDIGVAIKTVNAPG